MRSKIKDKKRNRMRMSVETVFYVRVVSADLSINEAC
jgi:hypothetical protein